MQGLFADLQSVERRMDSVMAVLDEAVDDPDRSKRLRFRQPGGGATFSASSLRPSWSRPQGQIRERFDLYDESGSPIDPEQQPSMRALRVRSAIRRSSA